MGGWWCVCVWGGGADVAQAYGRAAGACGCMRLHGFSQAVQLCTWSSAEGGAGLQGLEGREQLPSVLPPALLPAQLMSEHRSRINACNTTRGWDLDYYRWVDRMETSFLNKQLWRKSSQVGGCEGVPGSPAVGPERCPGLHGDGGAAGRAMPGAGFWGAAQHEAGAVAGKSAGF